MTAFLRLRVLGQEARRDAIVSCHVSALFFKKNIKKSYKATFMCLSVVYMRVYTVYGCMTRERFATCLRSLDSTRSLTL
jgi:hypothetical protein